MNLLARKLSLPVFIILLVILLAVTAISFASVNNDFNTNNASVSDKSVLTDFNKKTSLPEVDLPDIYIEQATRVEYGKTLAQKLLYNGFTQSDIHYATRAMNQEYSLNRMPAGAEFLFSFKEPEQNARPELARLSLYTKDDRYISVSRNKEGRFKADIGKRPVVRVPHVASGTINNSLYLAARNAGLPDRLIVPFIQLFSWDLDFTRDIRKNDSFRVIYEKIQNPQGEFIRYGKILAGQMTLKRKDKPVSAFLAPDGEYYSQSGRAKKRALLRTPIEFTRISSHFDPNRMHPVLGYTRAHKGTDFAAPTGTPIKASGDGRVKEVEWKSGYGRYIRIGHNSTFSTAYAHLSRYKRGLNPGDYVKQGDTIGYVGMSGTATGPHLHYEVLRNGRQVNAMKVKLPKGKPLAEKYRDEFNRRIAMTKKLWAQENKLAQQDNQ